MKVSGCLFVLFFFAFSMLHASENDTQSTGEFNFRVINPTSGTFNLEARGKNMPPFHLNEVYIL